MLITRRMEFSATHRLWRSDWDESRNKEVFGPRADRRQHGHNYVLEVTLRGPVHPETGMVMDLKALKDVLSNEVDGPPRPRTWPACCSRCSIEPSPAGSSTVCVSHPPTISAWR
jgi:hypothetical protein